MRREDIGGRAAGHAGALILDAVGCALAGWAAEETPGVLRAARGLGGDGRASIIGDDRPASLVAAVLANAYLTTAITACDVYLPSHCHLTPEVVPAALADGGLFSSYAPGDATAALADLGRDWELEQISVRLWPGATPVQALLTALLAGGRRLPAAGDLVSVEIRVPPATYDAHHDLAHPAGTFEALLSFHYVAAATILHRRFGIDLADPAVCADPDITKFIDQRCETRMNATRRSMARGYRRWLPGVRRLVIRPCAS